MNYNQGFETGDGVIIVGGFFNKVARESSYAKMSLGTLPKVKVPKPNKELKIVKDFLLALRTSQQKAVYDCYSEYNAQGGRVLTLQTGSQVITFHINHITSHHMTSHHITSHHTSHHITSHHITSNKQFFH